MKDKTTLRIESNTLIAKFMDVDVMSMSLEEFRKLPKIDKTFCNGTLAQDLTYDVDWNSLMTAVEKCLILTCDNDWHEWDLSIAETLRSVDKKTVYEEVLSFIKWYNENK